MPQNEEGSETEWIHAWVSCADYLRERQRYIYIYIYIEREREREREREINRYTKKREKNGTYA